MQSAEVHESQGCMAPLATWSGHSRRLPPRLLRPNRPEDTVYFMHRDRAHAQAHQVQLSVIRHCNLSLFSSALRHPRAQSQDLDDLAFLTRQILSADPRNSKYTRTPSSPLTNRRQVMHAAPPSTMSATTRILTSPGYTSAPQTFISVRRRQPC